MTRHGVGTGLSGTPDDQDGLLEPTSSGFEIQLEFNGVISTVAGRRDEFLLDTAGRYGIWLPRTCRQGWCITCAARIRHGRAEHSAARRFYLADEAAGFALLCTARPLTPMILLAGQQAAFRAHRIRNGLAVPRA